MTNDSTRKLIFGALIILSFALYIPVIVVSPDQLTVGRFIGLVGLQLIWWQVALGTRQITRLVTEDILFVNKVHRFIGTYGFLFILFHPLLMLASYGLSLIWPPSIASSFDIGVRAGLIGLSLLAFVWVTSALFRHKIGWRRWKRMHLFAYALFPILFLHMALVGSSIHQFPLLKMWLYSLAVLFGGIVLLHAAGRAGLDKKRYGVITTEKVAKDVTRFTLSPQSQGLVPLPGQFAYFQSKRFGESHPFTISHYDSGSGEISFSIKAVGSYSRRLTALKPGGTVFIDGPHGIFTRELGKTNRPVVAIAGGIGITPFLRHIEAENIDHLFWGCRTVADIAYKDVVDSSSARTLYVLSEQDVKQPGYASGIIDSALIEERLDQPLTEYEFYFCGPPPMMKALYIQLTDEGVPPKQIHQEKFSL